MQEGSTEGSWSKGFQNQGIICKNRMLNAHLEASDQNNTFVSPTLPFPLLQWGGPALPWTKM